MACADRRAKAVQWAARPYVRSMAATLYMDAVITPNRSLSRKGFVWLIGGLVAVNLAIATLMLALGALPVPIFLGLDVVGVLIAFRASYRGAGQSERVQVSAEEVRVLHQIGRSARTVWASPTAFTRVSVEAPGEPEVRVRLHLSQRALTLARALSPPERIKFADALEAAIRQARAERH
jgi:uncharacterized membrane protein